MNITAYCSFRHSHRLLKLNTHTTVSLHFYLKWKTLLITLARNLSKYHLLLLSVLLFFCQSPPYAVSGCLTRCSSPLQPLLWVSCGRLACAQSGAVRKGGWGKPGKASIPDTHGIVRISFSLLNHELHEGKDYGLFAILSPVVSRVPRHF